MHRIALALAGLCLLALPAAAQAQEEPETRIMTITAFHVPFGPALQEFMRYADEYMVPSAAADPHVLMFRIATHYWGTTDVTLWLITEYASLTEMELSNDWQGDWYDEHYPEGTPERESADQAFEESFLPYFVQHVDHILNVNMNRAK